MADFATFVTAAEPALGWSDGAFMNAYSRNRDLGREIVLEADSVVQAILSWNPVDWDGTATELLAELEDHAPVSVVRSQYWPKSASMLSNKLKRHVPVLRAMGINVEWTSEGKGNSKQRIIKINRVEESSSDPSDHNELPPF